MDYAKLLENAYQRSPEPPDWLQPGRPVYVPNRGLGHVVDLLGRRILVAFGNEHCDLGDWQHALQQNQLLPPESAPQQSQLKVGNIGTPTFRALATHLQQQGILRDIQRSSARAATTDPIPSDLPESLKGALEQLGIDALYCHQAQALTAMRAGQDVCLATETSSGKTLAFALPLFEACLRDRDTSVLALWPLKALANDQLAKLHELNQLLPPEERLTVGIITGDTPIEERKALLARRPHLLGMSPEVLQRALYATGRRDGGEWRDFLKRLRTVVADESHAYLATFGAGMKNLFRRLYRCVDAAGGSSERLQWAFASATIGNPSELAGTLADRDPQCIQTLTQSGAAQAERTLLTLEATGDPNATAAELIAQCLQHGLTGIAFANNRSAIKRLLRRAQNRVARAGLDPSQIAIFHGSLKAERRRAILQQVATGRVGFVLGTQALELGIDISEFDVALLRGFPGSVMAAKQRIGRVGRSRAGLAIYIPSTHSPLDAYYRRFPEQLLAGDPEPIAIDSDHPATLGKHLLAGAAEAGIPSQQLAHYFGPAAGNIAGGLLDQGELRLNRRGYYYAKGYPHKTISLRGNEQTRVAAFDTETGEELETLDAETARRELHPGAIYTTQNTGGGIANYRCRYLDEDAGKAELEPAPSDRSTNPDLTFEIDLQRTLKSASLTGMTLTLGWGRITESVTGYEVLQYRPEKQAPTPLGRVTFDAPYVTEFEAPILRLELDDSCIESCQKVAQSLREQLQREETEIPKAYEVLESASAGRIGLHSLGHQLLLGLPLAVLCNHHDLDFVTESPETSGLSGAFFDTIAGGSGSSEALFAYFGQVAARARELVEACDCEAGCPQCLVSPRCPEQNKALLKQLGGALLATLAPTDNRGAY